MPDDAKEKELANKPTAAQAKRKGGTIRVIDLGPSALSDKILVAGEGPLSLWDSPVPRVFDLGESFLSPYYRNFVEELAELRKRSAEQATALKEEKIGAEEKQRRIAELESTLSQLRSKEQIGFLLDRVNQRAQRQLLASEDFRQRFLQTKECVAFVMAVDIRRSTELMLKARSPEAFADFITTLCRDLMHIITESYGVFDKFTGDGVLAFFPDFYSGSDAAYYAVSAADRCHASFRDHYQRLRKSFSSVLTGIGLGIGVDYGAVHLVQIAGGLTVVGSPVVYACRLSGAPAGVTLANQPAYETVSDSFGAMCFIAETNIEIKHEGGMLAYDVRLNGREYTPKPPEWLQAVPPSKT